MVFYNAVTLLFIKVCYCIFYIPNTYLRNKELFDRKYTASRRICDRCQVITRSLAEARKSLISNIFLFIYRI